MAPGQLLVVPSLLGNRGDARMNSRLAVAILALIGFCVSASSSAASPAWPFDPLVIAPNHLIDPPINWSWPDAPHWVGKGANGAFLFWNEVGTGNRYEVSGQRLSPTGTAFWGDSGKAIVAAKLSRYLRGALGDGAGGAYVAWDDEHRLAIQRINPIGRAMWSDDGVDIASFPEGYGGPYPVLIGMLSDGAGGLFVGWLEYEPSERSWKKFIQRVSRDGRLLWGTDGVEVAPQDSLSMGFNLGFDGAGGVVAVWASTMKKVDLADRIDPNGKSLWDVRGVPVAERREGGDVYPDGRGGVIIASGPWAQRLDDHGERSWGNDGVSISTCLDNPITLYAPERVRFSAPDDHGGCFLVWRGCRDLSVSEGVYAQHLDSSGRELWSKGGIPVGGPVGNRSISSCLPDGAGGLILLLVEDDETLVAQHVNADGLLLSGAAGIRVGEASRSTSAGLALDPGHLLVAWSSLNYLSPTTSGLFATEVALDSMPQRAPGPIRVNSSVKASQLALEGFRPNPALGTAQIAFTLAGSSPARLELYSTTGRLLFTREVGGWGAGSHILALGDAGLSPGVYWVRVTQAGNSVTKKSVLAE
jgi:hypothetical protein